ncbi:exodeoxyribonuclease VII large subunit [Prevotella sp. PCHR]|uniref:Exodeoxyribonuclease 7 large subunit n=1 Tax=Xylanibacter caecicola TaxID=2736294 RepID=A0ABX2B0K3_9BACT|nr:exodeoxyribonuclease VII large subunit [Xylanibacter caecicola]NPE24987.1 exodeoxyribonuclease VII large subunit [Xylanibacter caecicola]
MTHRISLKELNMLVRDTISLAMPDDYWVEAELSEIREVRGHCYMELIQKDPHTNTPVARASANCWASTWMLVRSCFERATGQRLSPGMKVLMQVHARFHENYGFSWIVTDIDPTYTLGDMARKRREIVRVLKEEGVFDLNKELVLSSFAQRIAVVSSASAAGYGDFCHQLQTNEYGYVFYPVLFSAVMQGEGIEQSIIAALDGINAAADNFDCVVIIRGGGATSDLSGFDTLALAENVANFPLPVITGIGHERDESVLDMVAHTSVKTPTAAAALLIDNLRRTETAVDNAMERMVRVAVTRLKEEKMRLDRISDNVPVLFSLVKARRNASLDVLRERLRAGYMRRMDTARTRCDFMEQRLRSCAVQLMKDNTARLDTLSRRVEAADPVNILRRGYSITLVNGRAVRSAACLKEGDEVETRLEQGAFTAVVRDVEGENV